MQFSSKQVFLGVPDNAVIQLVTSIGKSMIAKEAYLSVDHFILKFKTDIINEKCMAQRCGQLQKFEKMWGNINAALEYL